MMNLLRNQEGKAESKAPLIITLIIIAILGFLAYKFVPVKWKYVEFSDEVQEVLNINYSQHYKEAARGAFNEYTMREQILELAKKHNIPIVDADRQVDVKWPEKRIFTVSIDYDEIIDLPIYGPYIWKFHLYVEQDPMSGKAI
ncbi:hypothetical protein JW823_06820 [bacterium]|nr:hypothetical protein [candidate division CSSED10-310 bacterium]